MDSGIKDVEISCRFRYIDQSRKQKDRAQILFWAFNRRRAFVLTVKKNKNKKKKAQISTTITSKSQREAKNISSSNCFSICSNILRLCRKPYMGSECQKLIFFLHSNCSYEKYHNICLRVYIIKDSSSLLYVCIQIILLF